MLEKVSSYVKKHNMLNKGDRVVVGLSGGADSVALLHVLLEYKKSMDIELFATHINHSLRGEHADEDEEFSKQLCNKWGIDIFLHKADIRTLAKQWQRSEEETGRIVRHDFYEQVLRKTGSNRIATGHHKDDQAETILHHIIRGTGIEGLSGIKPIRDDKYIRPLLCVTRSEIEDYLNQKGLGYRIDATNAESDYTRNRIRNELLPQVVQYNPSIVDSLSRLGSIALEENDFLSQYSGQLFDDSSVITKDHIDIDLDSLFSMHTALQKRVLRLALKSLRGDLNGISYTHIEDIVEMITMSKVGSVITLPGGLFARLGYEYLRITGKLPRPGPDYFEVPIDIPGEIVLKDIDIKISAKQTQQDSIVYSDDCIYVDRVKIKGRLKVRQRRDGDRFKPLGMTGTKKLKDYFIDRKIPEEQRNSIPLLVDEENIIWVVGCQMNDDYKLTNETKNVIKFSYWR